MSGPNRPVIESAVGLVYEIMCACFIKKKYRDVRQRIPQSWGVCIDIDMKLSAWFRRPVWVFI